MHLCIFEDDLAKNFLPLTYFRPVFDLRCGILTLRDRIIRHIGSSSVSLIARRYLHPLLQEENPDCSIGTVPTDATLLVNGRCIVDASLARQFKKKLTEDVLFACNNEIAAARLSGENLCRVIGDGDAIGSNLSDLKLPRIDVEARFIRFPWDIVHGIGEMVRTDFEFAARKGVVQKGDVHRSAILVGKKNISIGKKAVVGPSAVLVAESGPIHIGNNARIHPMAYIKGPCSIGEDAEIKAGARISSAIMGPQCKVGGEIQHSIFQAHSSKQHDGFVGHSYIGEWVNLGAGTTTSNLKNTYGSVRVKLKDSLVDSGQQFFGSIIGDHAKTSINSSFSAGTTVGVSSNLLGPEVHHGKVPSFSWGREKEYSVYDLPKALEVAAKVMARRSKKISSEYEKAFRTVFELTSHERTDFQ